MDGAGGRSKQDPSATLPACAARPGRKNLKKQKHPIRRPSSAARLVNNSAGDSDFDRYSVAILTRSNPDGRNMLGAGRASTPSGLQFRLLDNTLIPAVLLARLSEHPGDEFARQHVLMSALAPVVSLEPVELTAWARLIREQGWRRIRHPPGRPAGPEPGSLERNRLRLLISIAADFDRMPGGNALPSAPAAGAEIPAEQSGSNIHILTMHKAKGLNMTSSSCRPWEVPITAHSKEPLLVHEAGDEPFRPWTDPVLPETKALEADPAWPHNMPRTAAITRWRSCACSMSP